MCNKPQGKVTLQEWVEWAENTEERCTSHDYSMWDVQLIEPCTPSDSLFLFTTSEIVKDIQKMKDMKTRIHQKYIVIDKLRDILDEVSKIQ